jgi:hypothetical protein
MHCDFNSTRVHHTELSEPVFKRTPVSYDGTLSVRTRLCYRVSSFGHRLRGPLQSYSGTQKDILNFKTRIALVENRFPCKDSLSPTYTHTHTQTATKLGICRSTEQQSFARRIQRSGRTRKRREKPTATWRLLWKRSCSTSGVIGLVSWTAEWRAVDSHLLDTCGQG